MVGSNRIQMLLRLEQIGPLQLVMCAETKQVVSDLLIKKIKIGDHPILVAETLVIREAVVAVIQKQLSEVIIKSGWLIAIQAIGGEIRLVRLGLWLKISIS